MLDVIDTIHTLSDDDLAVLKRLGIRAVSRYIAPHSNIGKIMRSEEYHRILRYIALVVNFETSGTTWRQGRTGGSVDGAFALSYSRNVLGHPGQVTFSIDEYVAPEEYDIAYAYAAEIAHVFGYPQSIYGPSGVIQHLANLGVNRFPWQWKDGSHPNAPATAIRQRYPVPWNLGYTYDTNESVKAQFGQFVKINPPEPTPQPKPPPPIVLPKSKEREMLLIDVMDDQGNLQSFRLVYNGHIKTLRDPTNEVPMWRAVNTPEVRMTAGKVLEFCADFFVTQEG